MSDSFRSKVWGKLRDVSSFNDGDVDQKGRFLYLKWQAAWRILVENYPESSMDFQQYDRVVDGNVITSDVCYYDHSTDQGPTGSVTCILVVADGEDAVTLRHTYPITDYSNRAIQWPNAFDINTARMRAFVKAAAMLGLGLHIFEGDVDSDGSRASIKRAASVNEEEFINALTDGGYDVGKVTAFIKSQRGGAISDLSEGDAASLMQHISKNKDTFAQQ